MYSNNAATVRRMGFLQRILVQRTFQSIQLNLTRAYAIDGKITIDGVEKDLKAPQNPEFVPRKFGMCLDIKMILLSALWT